MKIAKFLCSLHSNINIIIIHGMFHAKTSKQCTAIKMKYNDFLCNKIYFTSFRLNKKHRRCRRVGVLSPKTLQEIRSENVPHFAILLSYGSMNAKSTPDLHTLSPQQSILALSNTLVNWHLQHIHIALSDPFYR